MASAQETSIIIARSQTISSNRNYRSSTTIASMSPSAMAVNNVASRSVAQSTITAQTGLVKAAGDIGVSASASVDTLSIPCVSTF
jgi:hypothetical protein